MMNHRIKTRLSVTRENTSRKDNGILVDTKQLRKFVTMEIFSGTTLRLDHLYINKQILNVCDPLKSA